MSTYVIVGNSIAAVGCIEGIRQIDAAGRITVVSREPYPVYGRPLISYLLQGKTDEARMAYRGADFYEKNGAEVLYGVTATAVDADAGTVALSDGGTLAYDRLLLATGSRALVPPFAGLETVEKRFSFMTLGDAKALAAALTPQTRTLIVGAGLIGLKCAEGIRARCASVTVCDLADHVLPSVLDAPAAALVQEHLEQSGIDFCLGDSVERFSKNTATLKSGRTLPFDLLVVAVGVRPETALAVSAGAEVARGIVTDLHCETTREHIYAAGDCAQCRDLLTGESRMLALLPNAYMAGSCAGINMAGGDAVFDTALAMNAVGFFGLHTLTAGVYDGEVYRQQTQDGFKELFYKDDRLRGFILIGDVAGAGIYTALLRERTPLSQIDFERIKQHPQLMAFDGGARAYRLNEQPAGKAAAI
ncbi:MAG: FAD-dependent oxidoreductase [Oscillospiraceae bacterium]|nr:FAD-dependent oxidoreductase [Oscillospiraceae bacterium]